MQPCRDRLGKRLFFLANQPKQLFEACHSESLAILLDRIDPQRQTVEQIVIIEGDDALRRNIEVAVFTDERQRALKPLSFRLQRS